MCFGSSQTSSTQSQTTSPAWLSSAAQGNVGFAQNLENTGFTPYSGNQVAPFSAQQEQSFGAGTDLYNSVNGGQIGSMVSGAAGAGPSSVSPNTISSAMSPYMNQYVMQALAPQINNLNNQESLQSQLTQGQATSAGAFGDPRASMLQTNQNAANSLQEQGLVGNAYNAAFNTAIGAGAQDVANNLTGQTTNANLNETALQRQLSGANELYGLGSGVTNTINTLGGQQTAQSQAGLNAQYNQWLMAQQYPFQTAGLVNSTIGAAYQPAGTNTNSTTSAPNNSGYGLLGSLAGATGSALGGGSLGTLATIFAADGGNVPGGGPILVGERGPELFYPGVGGVVVPNEVMEAARDKREKKVGKGKPKSGSLPAFADGGAFGMPSQGATLSAPAPVPMQAGGGQMIGQAAPPPMPPMPPAAGNGAGPFMGQAGGGPMMGHAGGAPQQQPNQAQMQQFMQMMQQRMGTQNPQAAQAMQSRMPWMQGRAQPAAPQTSLGAQLGMAA